MPDISVIMPSLLADYPNAASDRDGKIHRAIDSCFYDTRLDVELVVIADGCERTMRALAVSEYRYCNLITWSKQKQPPFSGELRNEGIRRATAPIISYLDNDDMFMPGHLFAIVEAFRLDPAIDWVFYDDYVATGPVVAGRGPQGRLRNCQPTQPGFIGTSSIAHRRELKVVWGDGYGHDWRFVEQLVAQYPRHKKIQGCGYLVCHVPGQADF